MTTILSVTLLIAAVLPLPASVSGADATIFEVLTGDRAPSQNSVYAVEQDRNGRLWIGTLGGLHVYDGRTTEVVRSLSPGQDVEAVRVISLHQDEKGLLWVGGMHATLDVLDLEELTVTSYGDRLRKAISPHAQPDVVTVRRAPDGDHWIGTRAGLYVLDSVTDDIRPHSRLLCPEDRALPVSHVEFLADGSAIVRTSRELVHVDAQGLAEVVTGPDEPYRYGVSVLDDGGVWAMGSPGILERVTVEDGEVVLHPLPLPVELADWRISSAVGDPDHELWLLSERGSLAAWERHGGVTIHEPGTDQPDRRNFLHQTYTMTRDASGVVWFGSSGHGVHYFSPGSTRFAALGMTATPDVGLTDDYFWDVLPLGDGRIVALDRQEIIRFRPGDDGVEFLEGGRAFPSDDRYHSIVRLDDGRALVGTMNGELLAFDDPAALRPTLTRVAEPCSHDAHLNIIWHLARSADGGVWVCRKEHTDLYDADLATRVDLPDDLSTALEGATVRTVLVDVDGTTWLGSDNVGLIRYGADGDVLVLDRTTGLAHDGVRGLHRDGDALWIGTYRGLHRLDLASLHRGEVELRVWNTSDGLPNDVVYDILPGPRGDLWLSTNEGLVRFWPTTGSLTTYTMADGLPNGEFNGGAACVTSNGVIVFGGIDGLTWTRPETLYRNSVRPAAALVHHHGDGSVDDVPGVLVPSNAIVLPWRQPHLEFSLAALDYQQPDRNRTRYRIEGLGTGWTETRPGETIHFPRVPAGRYSLEYQAANNDGVWGPVSTVDIRCEAAPWATTAARAGYALTALAMVGWLLSLEYRRRRRKELLEQRLAQADKLQAVGQLAGGLAHDFNNYLQVIMGQAEIGGFDLEDQHPTHECLDEIRTAGERARVLVQRILSLGRTSDACLETRDLGRTTGDVENMLRSLAGERVDLFLDLDPTPLPVRMDDKQIGHALTNLVVNARDAMGGRGRIAVSVRRVEFDRDTAEQHGLEPGATPC